MQDIPCSEYVPTEDELNNSDEVSAGTASEGGMIMIIAVAAGVVVVIVLVVVILCIVRRKKQSESQAISKVQMIVVEDAPVVEDWSHDNGY